MNEYGAGTASDVLHLLQSYLRSSLLGQSLFRLLVILRQLHAQLQWKQLQAAYFSQVTVKYRICVQVTGRTEQGVAPCDVSDRVSCNTFCLYFCAFFNIFVGFYLPWICIES